MKLGQPSLFKKDKNATEATIVNQKRLEASYQLMNNLLRQDD